MDTWREQAQLVRSQNGLLSFIVHPDYSISQKAQDLYRELLEMIAEMRETGKLWAALPKEIDTWWRARDQMRLEWHQGRWRIVGNRAEEAQVAFATLDGNDLILERSE